MTSPTFEEIVEPETPIEKWIADHRVLIADELFTIRAEIAEVSDSAKKDQCWDLARLLEVAQARLDHIDELDSICDCRLSPDDQRDHLADHVVWLESAGSANGSETRQVDQDIVLAKISDTLSLRRLVPTT